MSEREQYEVGDEVPFGEKDQIDTLKKFMQSKLLELQNLCDFYGCSQGMQNNLLHVLFSRLGQNNNYVQSLERTFGDVFKKM